MADFEPAEYDDIDDDDVVEQGYEDVPDDNDEVLADDEDDEGLDPIPKPVAPPVRSRRRPIERPSLEEEDVPEDDEEEAPKQQVATQDQKEWNRLAYENRVMRREQQIMQQRFDMLMQAIQRGIPQEEPEEERIPDPEEDLQGHLVKKLEVIDRKLQQEQEEEKRRAEEDQVVQRFNYAREMAVQYRQGNPELYDQAVNHLTSVMFQEMQEEYPHLTDEQIIAELGNQAGARMIQWVNSGKHPGVELMKLAQRRGFSPQQLVQQQVTQQAQPKPKADARQHVEAGKQREQKARTISAVQGGAAAAGMSVRKLAQMNDEEFQHTVKRIAKTAGRGKVPFSELLRGKGKPDSVGSI